MRPKDIRLTLLAAMGFLCLLGGVWFLAAGLVGSFNGSEIETADANIAVQVTPQPSPQSAAQAPTQPAIVADPLPSAPLLSPEAQAQRKALEAKIAAAPDLARFFDKLKIVAPTDFDTALTHLIQKQTGQEADSPDLWLAEAVKTLRQSRGALAAKADGPTLGRVFEKQLILLKTLGETSSALCVDFLYGGASDDFYKFSAAHRALVVDQAVAGLDAIVDGRQKNITRTAPTDSDFQAFENILKQKGLNQTEIEALLDGKTPEPPLPDARMCKAGQIYIETLISLPDPARARIQALAIELLARS